MRLQGVLYDATGDARCVEVADLTPRPRPCPAATTGRTPPPPMPPPGRWASRTTTPPQGLMTFPGLAHRMETVGQLGRVRFVNDSKATNADAARQALTPIRKLYWIAGGARQGRRHRGPAPTSSRAWPRPI